MALAEDLLEWVRLRPWWQQRALAHLAVVGPLNAADYQAIATELLTDPPATPKDGWLSGSLEPSPSDGEQVRLLAVGDLSNVNALVADQTLTFGDSGMTVVYGDNGSGKSGYARLIKRVVRARHQEDILPNIFVRAGSDPEAVVRYAVGATTLDERWTGHASGPLAQVAFYDERCGDQYVSVEAEVSYRPSSLRLLDALIEVCDGVRGALDELLRVNMNASQPLPAADADTQSGQFLSSLSAATTDSALDAACALPGNVTEELERLAQEDARLRQSDPTKEKDRLLRTAEALDAAAGELTRLSGILGTDAEIALRALGTEAAQKRAAANVASSASFDHEPLPGVGSETWRALWGAARRFSETEAQPDHAFPAAEVEGHCPLCQQILTADANARLHRFHAFMSDDTQNQAETAERDRHRALTMVRATQTVTPSLAVHLETLTDTDADTVAAVRAALATYDQRRTALSSLTDAEPTAPDAEPSTDLADTLTTKSAAARQQAETLDATQVTLMLDSVVSERRNLEAQQTLAAGKDVVAGELQRRRERALLDEARRQTDTSSVTRKSTELTRTYVTTTVQDRFSRESDRLGVERVTLRDSGGRKGQLMHRPAFLAVEVRAELPRVLSEGEQTALGLAGFFTEAYFDETNSALVLDDPVTSLDHLRRSKVAARLAELAKDRQVIVFTHDNTFTADLRKASEQADVTFTERAVERRRKDDAPGICHDAHPWSTKDAKARLDQLKTDLARINREQGDWGGATYEKETGIWAGGLSETWERIISMEIANPVVDRGTLEVHVSMVRLFARITEDDDKELQQSYSRCSQWAKRHDKDGALNYVAPKIADLEAELALVKAWFERVKKYKNR
jgi:energy-coupling factor transporter ATP-binding protein EcfA2